MTLTLTRAPRRAATALLAGLVLLPVAGCGGDDASPAASASGGLARFAPATSPFYAEAAIQPEGDQKSDLDALIGKFAPGKSFDGLVAQAFKDSKVDYERDVKPWLGKRAGLAVTALPATSGGDPEVAAFIETTDADKAVATLRKTATGKVSDREYGGTKYLYDEGDENAAGIVDDTLVLATEAAFKTTVDTAKGKGIDTNDAYHQVTDKVSDGSLAYVYGDISKALELAQKAASGTAADASSLESVRELLNRRGLKTFAAALDVTGDAVSIRAATTVKDDGQGDATAETLADLPAGSWAALGLGDLGKSLSDGLDALKGIKTPGFDVQSGLDQLEQQAGIDIQKDLLSWMGKSGVFVRGTSVTDIGGALVVQSKDPAATKAALAKARTLVAGAGLPAKDLSGNGIDDGFSLTPGNAAIEVFAALAGDRFVLAVNRTSLDEALKPNRKLADDDTFKAAGAQLGDGFKPTFFLDFPKVAGLIGGLAGGQPGYAEAKQYLDKIGTVSAGTKRDGDVQLSSFAVGVK